MNFGLSELHLNRCIEIDYIFLTYLICFDGLETLEWEGRIALDNIVDFDSNTSSIKVLKINNNHYRIDTEIIDKLVSLPYLTHVYFNTTYLAKSPHFQADSKIYFIEVKWNMFEGVDEIESLFQPELETLNIYNSDVTDLPDIDYSESKIKTLLAGYSGLSQDALNTIVYLPLLEELHLHEFYGGDLLIPPFPSSTRIKKLKVSKNAISPQTLAQILTSPSLRELNASSCNIKDLPVVDCSKVMLTALDLSDNQLTSAALNYIKQFKLLEHIDISGCCLDKVSDFLSKPLKQLNMSSNNNLYIGQVFTASKTENCVIEELDASECTVDQIALNNILYYQSIKILRLSKCNLVLSNPFNNYYSIIDLDLSHNILGDCEIVYTIFNITSLKKLDISNCGIKNLKFDPLYCYITALNVSKNSLDKTSLELISQIRSLYIIDVVQSSEYDSVDELVIFAQTHIVNISITAPQSDLGTVYLNKLIPIVSNCNIDTIIVYHRNGHHINWSKLFMYFKKLKSLTFSQFDFSASPKSGYLKQLHIKDNYYVDDKLLTWLELLKGHDKCNTSKQKEYSILYKLLAIKEYNNKYIINIDIYSRAIEMMKYNLNLMLELCKY